MPAPVEFEVAVAVAGEGVRRESAWLKMSLKPCGDDAEFVDVGDGREVGGVTMSERSG